jgi:hypothetical protein
MAKVSRTWARSLRGPSQMKIPDAVKAAISVKAQHLVDADLKPAHIKPTPKKADFNYLIDLHVKWNGRYLIFCSTYACPGPHALSPTFESRFARMEYVGQDRFNLSYMRHTERWWEVYSGLTLEECFNHIKEDHLFLP